jgi:hypothetical protein
MIMYCKRNTICISFFVLFSLLLFNLSNIPYPSLNAYAQYSNQGDIIKIQGFHPEVHPPITDFGGSSSSSGSIHPPTTSSTPTGSSSGSSSGSIHPPTTSSTPTGSSSGSSSGNVHPHTTRGTHTGSSSIIHAPYIQPCINVYLPVKLGGGIVCLKLYERTQIHNLLNPIVTLKPLYGGWCSFGDYNVRVFNGYTHYCLESNR